MRWVIVGNKGMFGREIENRLVGLGHQVVGFNRENLDIEASEGQLAKLLESSEFVVNAVAYTAVDKAESELFEANRVNGLFAGRLAKASELSGSKLMHISTDYVFDGFAKEPYKIDSVTKPGSIYGESKLLGEQLIQDSNANYSIFRTAWLYGSHGRCFPKVIANLLENKDSISVVNDQIGSPTWTRDLADVVIDHATRGWNEQIVHAVSSGQTSWFGFAEAIRKSLSRQAGKTILPISTDDYPTPAKRPEWSVLDNSETEGLIIGDWLDRWKLAAPTVLQEFI
jgi:dTDP-4-dehydrorhamnose reductase